VTFVRVAAVLVTLCGAFPWTLVAYAGIAFAAKQGDRSATRAVAGAPSASTHELGRSMRDIDRRMAEVEQYVTTQNSSLAREIESLR
jgi:phage shock protein C